MKNEKDEHNLSCNRESQLDLFTLIGGSWPPAPRVPEHSEFRSAPIPRHTMHRTIQNDRIKSVNLIEHIAPDRRRNKPVNSGEEQKKMVHDPKKVETGILVDVCNNESSHGVHSSSLSSPSTSSNSRPSPNIRQESGGKASSLEQVQYCELRWNEALKNEPEELYDSPALGSPRAVPQGRSTPPTHIQFQDEIGVGSLVEVATDVDQHHYGVVRWIGIIDDTATAGVELEESVCGAGDGTKGGQRLFACGAGRGLFVPLALCRKDSRFADTPPPAHAPHPTNDDQQPECPVVPGVVPPLSSIGELAGKNRGIQGHHNSCYLDATLFAMFTFTSVFDALLYRPPEPEDSAHYPEVQRVLREEIVNPLRKHGYVRADRVMKLRTLLERLSDVPGLTTEEKDPEEFLNGLVAQLLRAEPFLKLSSGQESYCYQLFVEKDEHISLPTVQQLLEQSLATSGVKLSEVPSTLIIQMPRFGKNYKLYQQVLPSPLLDVTDLIEGLPRQCCVCGSLARWECGACAASGGGSGGGGGVGGGAPLDAGVFCRNCLRLVHHARHHNHKVVPLTVCEEYASVMESCTLPRVYMELFAVLCIETSHYVAFVKAGTGIDAPWCFFDSMADRKGEKHGYNIPEIVRIDSVGAWLGEEGERAAAGRSAHARRLLADAYMCFYRSADVAMYR